VDFGSDIGKRVFKRIFSISSLIDRNYRNRIRSRRIIIIIIYEYKGHSCEIQKLLARFPWRFRKRFSHGHVESIGVDRRRLQYACCPYDRHRRIKPNGFSGEFLVDAGYITHYGTGKTSASPKDRHPTRMYSENGIKMSQWSMRSDNGYLFDRKSRDCSSGSQWYFSSTYNFRLHFVITILEKRATKYNIKRCSSAKIKI